MVEPHADLRAGIIATLRRDHYRCDGVDTPEAAALMLRDHKYAHVVVDVDIPQPTYELVSSLSADANVILITDADPRDQRTPRYHLLRKPFSRDELLAHFVR